MQIGMHHHDDDGHDARCWLCCQLCKSLRVALRKSSGRPNAYSGNCQCLRRILPAEAKLTKSSILGKLGELARCETLIGPGCRCII